MKKSFFGFDRLRIAAFQKLKTGQNLKTGSASQSSADAARDRGEFAEAATLYEGVLAERQGNGDAGLHVQCGHMHKEAGHLGAAEAHYLAAMALTPNDPDLHLQLGHFYKVAGRIAAAKEAYGRAIALVPGWSDPSEELAILRYRFPDKNQSPSPPTEASRTASRPPVYIERLQRGNGHQ